MTSKSFLLRTLTRRAYLRVAPKAAGIAIVVTPMFVLVGCDTGHRSVVYRNAAIGLSLSYPRSWKQLTNANVQQGLRRDKRRAALLDSLGGSGAAASFFELLADPDVAYFVKPRLGDNVDAHGVMVIVPLLPETPIDELTKDDLRRSLASVLRGPPEWGILPLARHPDLVHACARYEFGATKKVQCAWIYVRPPFAVLLQIAVAPDQIDDMRSIAQTVSISGMRPLAN